MPHAATPCAEPPPAVVEPAATPRLLDVNEVAAALRCTPRHVWKLRDRRRMPGPIVIDRLVRWDADVFAAWIKAGCPAPDAAAPPAA